MSGIGRIVKAEFIKIFKKPSVYIMGALLAIVITISLFTFSPNSRITYDVNITGTDISAIYNEWLGNTHSEAKINLDKNIENSQSIVTYYSNLNLRKTAINSAVNDLIKAQKDLNASITAGESATSNNYYYSIIQTKLNELINAFVDDYNLSNQAFFIAFLNSNIYKSYYNEENTGLLNVLQEKVNTLSAINFNEYYKTNEVQKDLEKIKSPFIVDVIKDNLNKVKSHHNAYNNLIVTSATFVFEISMEFERINLVNSLTNLKNYIESVFSSSYPIAIIDEAEYNSTISTIEKAIDILEKVNESPGETKFFQYKDVLNKYTALKVNDKVESFISNLRIITLSDELIKELNNFLNVKIEGVRTQLINEISEFANSNLNSTLTTKKIEFLSKLTNYKTLTLNAKKYINNKIVNDILNSYFSSEILKLKDFKDYNIYKINEEIAKIDYLVKTKTFEQDYANVFAYNQNSTKETSVFDFMFFALKISSVIIIFFAIIMASNIVAYEFDTGTIKLLAIRPFKRSKILIGKLLAVLYFAIIFVIFSALISFGAGYSTYALNLTPVLVVFNAKIAFSMSPIILILINVLTIILEVIFYAIVALALSTIFRSFAGAMTTSFLFYISANILNLIFANQIWYSFLPFLNTDFFRFFGGAFVGYAEQSAIGSLLNIGLLSNANFFISLFIYIAFTFIITYISYLVFRRRDI